MTRLRLSAAPALLGLAAALLSACVATTGGGPVGGGGDPTGREVLIAARDACTRQAQRQGLSVTGVRDQQLITGARERPLGAQVDMNVRRNGQAQTLRCDYVHANRSAVLTGLGGGGPDPNRPLLADARNACIAQARRDGWRINQVRSEALVTGAGGAPVGATLNVNLERGGSRTAGRCEWVRATDRARLIVDADPGRGDRVLSDAREACMAAARDRGLRVNQVRSSTLTRSGGRVTGAELRLNVETRGGQRSAQSCTYVQSTGRARLSNI